MKIERVEAFTVSLPERREHPTAVGAGKTGDYVIVRLHAEGLVGLGEATVLKEWGGDYGRYYGEDPATTVKLITELFGPAIIGKDATKIEHILHDLDRTAKGYPYAKASIDIALHDIVGKASGMPVYQLLGGLYRYRIPVAHSLGILEMDRLLSEVESAIEEGIRTVKLKVGWDTERDVEVVERVRDLVGSDITITVDANQGWRDPKVAIQTLRRMEPYNVAFAEQPVEGLREMAQVTRAVDTRIMADESAWNASEVLEIARLHAADLISIYTTKPGGLLRAMKMGAVAEAAGFGCNVNGSAETGVGNAANLHLAAALKPVVHACVIPVSAPAEALPTTVAGRFYMDDVITEPFAFEDGALLVPAGPGLGVELDEDKVKQYRRD